MFTSLIGKDFASPAIALIINGLNALEFGDVLFHGGPTVQFATTASRRIEPSVVKDWKWVSAAGLPAAEPPYDDPDKNGENEYRERLEGKPARTVLERLSSALAASE
jgi:hypothetical protein